MSDEKTAALQAHKQQIEDARSQINKLIADAAKDGLITSLHIDDHPTARPSALCVRAYYSVSI